MLYKVVIEEIEQLLKSESFAKSVNRRALNALFRHVSVLKDPQASPEHKQQAYRSIKAIIQGGEPKPFKPSQDAPAAVKEPSLDAQDDLHTEIPSKPKSMQKPAVKPAKSAVSQPQQMSQKQSISEPRQLSLDLDVPAYTATSTPTTTATPSASSPDKRKLVEASKVNLLSPSKSIEPKMKPTVSAHHDDIPFPEDFHVHHGVDQLKFKEAWNAMTPEQKKITLDWHRQQLSSKKISKSLSNIHSLLSKIKRHL